MNKKISTDKLLSAGIAIGIMVIIAFMIFSKTHKAGKQPSLPEKKEAIEGKEAAAKPGYAIPKNIFPTDEEAKENMKIQLEKRQALDKALAERKQIATEIRKNVEESFNQQPVSTAGNAQLTDKSQPAAGKSSAKGSAASSNKQASDLMLKKMRLEQFKNKELVIHH